MRSSPTCKQAKNLRILVLNSCRDNPLAESSSARSAGPAAARSSAGLPRSKARTAPSSRIRPRPAERGRRQRAQQPLHDRLSQAHRGEGRHRHRVPSHRRRCLQKPSGNQVPEISISFFGEFYLNGKLQITVTPGKPGMPADPCADADRALEEHGSRRQRPRRSRIIWRAFPTAPMRALRGRASRR